MTGIVGGVDGGGTVPSLPASWCASGAHRLVPLGQFLAALRSPNGVCAVGIGGREPETRAGNVANVPARGTRPPQWRIAARRSFLRVRVPAGRLVGIDLARTLALGGMIATHLYRPVYDRQVSLAHQLAAGRASALFAVLAGLSLALVTGGPTPVTGRERRARSVAIVVRSVLLYGIGVALTHLGTGIAIVLQTYAVLLVAMLPFPGWRPRRLALLAGAWVVAGPLLLVWITSWWPAWHVTGWGTVTEHVQGIYPLPVWITYFWVGLAVGRLRLTGTRVATLLLAFGGLLAVAAVVVSDRLVYRQTVLRQLAADVGTTDLDYVRHLLDWGLAGFVPGGSNWWLAVSAPHSGTPFDLATTIGTALALVGACLLLARLLPRAITVLSGAGAMSLTIYTLHVVAMSRRVWPPEETRSFWIHITLLGLLGAAFRLARRRGPLEWLVSWVSGRAASVVRRP